LGVDAQLGDFFFAVAEGVVVEPRGQHDIFEIGAIGVFAVRFPAAREWRVQ